MARVSHCFTALLFFSARLLVPPPAVARVPCLAGQCPSFSSPPMFAAWPPHGWRRVGKERRASRPRSRAERNAMIQRNRILCYHDEGSLVCIHIVDRGVHRATYPVVGRTGRVRATACVMRKVATHIKWRQCFAPDMRCHLYVRLPWDGAAACSERGLGGESKRDVRCGHACARGMLSCRGRTRPSRRSPLSRNPLPRVRWEVR